jgi:hypothetical protein
VALGVPGRLRPRIFSTVSTTRVVGRQPNAPATLTPGEIPGIHFQRLSRPQGTWFCRKEPRKKSQATPSGIVRVVAHSLNHYATPGPIYKYIQSYIIIIIILEFLTFRLWLGNIHLSWDLVINRIRLGGLSYCLGSFLQLNMCQELQIFAFVCMYLDAS